MALILILVERGGIDPILSSLETITYKKINGLVLEFVYVRYGLLRLLGIEWVLKD